jgi:hypothetical protein
MVVTEKQDPLLPQPPSISAKWLKGVQNQEDYHPEIPHLMLAL